ncbi:MAG: hypothetical protein AMJ79_02675 [Phycisphaerae bacterium SM23_30]|nr:MAG: hypothetical protein AMJ79_02675 [Phycisphaerae bacterium SM23_30]
MGTVKSRPGQTHIRRIKGSAIIWKERCIPILGRHRSRIILLIILIMTLCGLSFSYLGVAVTGGFQYNIDHYIYTMVLLCLGLLWCVALSATSITAEKEARSWPILLTTAITDRHILLGKAYGTIRRCMIIWLFLIGHVLLFSVVGFINPLGLALMIMLVSGITIFFTGSGLYFSALCRHTTTAVIANFALAVCLWGIIPLLLSLSGGLVYYEHGYGLYMDVTNPFHQSSIIMEATTEHWWYFPRYGFSYLHFNWLALDADDWRRSTLTVFLTMFGYALTGLLFAYRARYRIRRNVF